MNIENYIKKIGLEAKKASYGIASAEDSKKNSFLNNLANRLLNNESEIINANVKDLTEAKNRDLMMHL